MLHFVAGFNAYKFAVIHPLYHTFPSVSELDRAL